MASFASLSTASGDADLFPAAGSVSASSPSSGPPQVQHSRPSPPALLVTLNSFGVNVNMVLVSFLWVQDLISLPRSLYTYSGEPCTLCLLTSVLMPRQSPRPS